MRLLGRIWLHGVLLFAGVIALVMITQRVMSDFDTRMVMRHHPNLAVALANGVLARASDPTALEAQLADVRRETPLHVTVFDAQHRVLATTITPPLPPAPVVTPGPARWKDDRLVVGAFKDDALVAYAVLQVPPAPSVPLHAALMLGAALLLAFVFVAAPLTWSIARPIERLGAFARELGSGNLAARATIERSDEIGDLARSFNTMASQIQRLRASERELLGDVSHELRTPLARMRVVLDLAGAADHEKARAYLAEITTDLAELEQLVDDIIVSARLDPEAPRWDAAQPPLRKVRVAIGEPVEAAIARFSARWPDRELAYEPCGDLLVVDADPVLLRRVVDNLLDNARKYSTAPIAINVSREGDSVRVEVVDHGIGIAPEDHARIFTAFFRADRSRARSSGGVGLGLVLARRIIETHGGSVGFTSELDRGSRFWFQLPLQRDAMDA